MKIFKNIVLVLVLSQSICAKLYAQLNLTSDLKVLAIGDSIDLNVFPIKVLEETVTDEHLGKYKGKWLIIDFWATYCQACINSLPNLQAIQDKYGENIQVLLVTSEDEARIKRTLERSEVLKNTIIRLPFLVQNKSLKQVFPHVTIPHAVIIDPEGTVHAITHSSEISDSNIKKLILGELVNFLVKDDFNENSRQDTDEVGVGKKSNLMWESRLLKQGIGHGRITRYEIQPFVRSVDFQLTPIDLFYQAYSFFKHGFLGPINSKRVLVEVMDSLSYMQYANKELKPLAFFPKKFPYLHYANRHEYDLDNMFSYHLKLPNGISDNEVFEIVMEDLNRYFPIKGKVEKREVPVWVIRATNSAYKKLNSEKADERHIFTNDSLGVINKPIERFFNLLKYFVDAEPFIDETGIEYPIDLVIDFHDSPWRDPRNGLVTNSPLDREILKNALEAKGLTMTLENREVEVLIIYD